MERKYDLKIMRENELFEIDGGAVTTAPQLGIFAITKWLKSLFS